jgi:uncharacterized protein with PIN domain
MFDRIQLGYRQRFRALLARVQPKRLDFGVELLMKRAWQRSEREGVPVPRALFELFELTRQRVDRRVALMQACAVAPPDGTALAPEHARFLCDESLGGLARWLRAAGYPARALRGLRGDALIAEARRDGGVLVTTDSRLWERRAILDRAIRAIWMPSGLDRVSQLAMLLRDLQLPLREPRCMGCGGPLVATPKDAVRERIPPRTARWRDDYFVCGSCGQLFWRGTHWERIAGRLAGLGVPRRV